MKKILIFFAAAFCLASCSEDEIETYSSSALANIGFMTPHKETGVLVETRDDQFVNFVENPDWTEFAIILRGSISDVLRDYDRTINLTYSGDFDVATQTDLPKSILVPANKVMGDVEFKVKRAALADEGRENIINVEVGSSEGLTSGIYPKLKIDISLTPNKWVCDAPMGDIFAAAVLGEPSKTKNKIVYEVYGTYKLNPELGGFGPNFNPIAKELRAYLDKYNADPAAYDNKFGPAPVKDEKGKIVKFSA